MQDEFSRLKSNATDLLGEESVPTTGAFPQATVTTGIPGKSSLNGIIDAVKSGNLSPEAGLRAAEEELAKRQGRRFILPSTGSRVAAYDRSCRDRAMFESNKQPFIFPGFTPEGDFWLSQGLTLVGAMSGKGKSTAAANILAGMVDYRPDTTALVLSNEEATDAILHRTACVLLKKPYMKFHHGRMFDADSDEVKSCARDLVSRIAIVNDPAWDASCLEDVQTILEGSAVQDVSMILIDYLQTITHSRESPDMETFKVLKKFGMFIRDYGRRAPVPVVVLCQLHPTSAASDFSARVQNDKTIYNDAFNVVEIEPNQDTGLTDFTIWKQRFGVSQGVKVSLGFNAGRYEQLGGL